METKKRLTIKAVTEAIRKISGDQTSELVKGDGYFYFLGDEESTWATSSVYVFRLTDLSFEEWVGIYQDYRNVHLKSTAK